MFQPTLEATVRYLQNTQREDGGFAEPGREPESATSAWVTLALASAGINPRDQTTKKQHYQAGHSAYSYLAENAHKASSTTDFQRELLVVDAAGTSPYDFGGVDLVGEILKRQIAQGSEAGGFHHEAGSTYAGVNDTIFAILALSPIHETAVQEAIGKAAEWLEAQQHCDGGWPAVDPRPQSAGRCAGHLLPGEEKSEIDMTGAAIQALMAAGRAGFRREGEAFEFLHKAQDADGGFPEIPEGLEPNVASTAWAAQAMWAVGVNPETWVKDSELATDEPLGYLASMQRPDGHIQYAASEEMNGMWMTAYVTPAFTGNPWPFPAPPYEQLPALPPEESGAGAGEGGESDSGVISGGGGDRAPLFSRPQPKSKGQTPGGALQLQSAKPAQPRSRRKRNPGFARKHAVPAVNATRGSTAHKAAQARRAGKRASGRCDTKSNGGADPRPGARPACTGAGASGSGNAGALATGGEATAAGAEAEVNGVPIGDPEATGEVDRLEAGAPGLRSAEGGGQARWLTNAIYAAIALLIFAGALIEHRRPQTTP